MKKRTGVLFLLIALAVITFLDRLCIAVAGPRMQRELGIAPEQWGWVLGAFVLSYGLFEIPTGAMGDRKGQRGVLSRIVLWWSAFTSLTGAVVNFPQLVMVRFLFGAGEAGAYPNASGVVARWFPQGERGRAQGFIWAASRAGGAIAPLLVVPLLESAGWRQTFWIFGGFGALWTMIWYRWYHDRPADQPGITEAELNEIGLQRAASHVSIPWNQIVRNRQIWLIVAMYSCYVWGSWFYMTWFPTYLMRGAGFSESEMGIFSSLPFLLGMVGNLAGGFATDRMVKRYGLKMGRRAIACASLAASALLIFGLGTTRNKTAVVVLSTLGFGVMDLMLPAAWAVCMDIGDRFSGVVTGIMNASGQVGGFLCTVLFGYLAKAAGNYSVPLEAIAAMVMLSAVLFAFIDPTTKLAPAEDREALVPKSVKPAPNSSRI